MNEPQFTQEQDTGAPVAAGGTESHAVKPKVKSNPFYVLLVLLGIAFTVTACAYAVMAFRATKLNNITSGDLPANGLMTLMEQRGGTILAIEVLLLGGATVGAIFLDQYRQGAERDRVSNFEDRVV